MVPSWCIVFEKFIFLWLQWEQVNSWKLWLPANSTPGPRYSSTKVADQTKWPSALEKCQGCKKRCKLELPKYDETKSVKLDAGPDVVYLDDKNNTICGFKMYGCTCEPSECEWHQINMLDLIQTCVQSLATKKIELVCHNKIICSECSKYFNE